MSVSPEEARDIAVESFPGGDIQAQVEYQNLYLFKIFTDNFAERELDPFYSVNKDTGEFRDFSILEGDTGEILDLFFNAKEAE